MQKNLPVLFLSLLSLCVFGFLDAARPQDAEVKAAEALRNEGRYAEAITAVKSPIAIMQARSRHLSARRF
jgi:hypothetical protein